MQTLTSSDTMSIALAATEATHRLTWIVSYWDGNAASAALVGEGNVQGQTNGTSSVQLLGPPASGNTRHPRAFLMCNTDTAPVTATITIGTAAYKATLSVGDTLQMTERDGFFMTDPTGATKGATVTAWGSLTGSLASQTDLSAALAAKADAAATTTALAGKVPTTTTVNGHALSGNISLAPSDLSAVLGGLGNPGPDGTLPVANSSDPTGTTWDTLSSILPGAGIGVPFLFVNGDAGATVAGQIVRLNSSDGKAYLAQADTLAHCTNMLGAWLDAGKAQGQNGRVFRQGACPILIPFADAPAIGEFYLSSTAGQATSIAPNGTFFPRSLGNVIAVQAGGPPYFAWCYFNIPTDEQANDRDWTFPRIVTVSAGTDMLNNVIHFSRRFTMDLFIPATTAGTAFSLYLDGTVGEYVASIQELGSTSGSAAITQNTGDSRIALGSSGVGTAINLRARYMPANGKWDYMAEGQCPSSGTYQLQRYRGWLNAFSASIGVHTGTANGLPSGSSMQLRGC